MREIKFRARHKETGEWYYGSSLIADINQGDEYNLTLSLFWLQVEKGWLDIKTVGQYTGLKDKNGKEIYEGDIIGMPHPAKEGMCWEVVWHDFRWQILLRGMEDTQNYYVNAGEHLDDDEVIGNIYENPELLGS